MKRNVHRLHSFLAKPTTIRAINGWAIWFWLALAIPAVVVWKTSVLFVILISLWANIISHYTAWLAARVEVRGEHIESEVNHPAEAAS